MPADSQPDARILVVDDEAANVVLLERLLRHAGYGGVRTTTDPRAVVALYDEIQPDLILLDLHMPHRDGIALLGDLRARMEEGGYVPVLVLTADVTADALRNALEAGAKDFLTKPFDQQEVLLRIRNLLDTRFLHLALRDQNRVLEDRVRERTQRLLQAEKLSAMGQLLAGVAHELNNPLSVVLGQAALMQEIEQESTRAQKIGRAAERCARIVRNFLALAREQPPARGETRVNLVVQEAIELIGYELRTGDIDVRLHLARDLPVLWADAHQLHQVVVNLVVNAQHAMARTPPPRVLTVTTETVGDARVRLAVGDSGPGIPPELQERIFEPFFTTKGPGQGTGLGLSLSRGIVEGHDGTLTVESRPGLGSTFRVELPVVAPPADLGAAAAPAAGAERLARRRLLVVDDEGDVSELLAELVERAGHEAHTAANGLEALERLAERHYDAVLCDTKMPELDGPGFYQAALERYPQLRGRVAFVTGDILNPEKRAFLGRPAAPHLAKPFELDEVRRVVHELLADR